jgi:hypothetical protein
MLQRKNCTFLPKKILPVPFLRFQLVFKRPAELRNNMNKYLNLAATDPVVIQRGNISLRETVNGQR